MALKNYLPVLFICCDPLLIGEWLDVAFLSRLQALFLVYLSRFRPQPGGGLGPDGGFAMKEA